MRRLLLVLVLVMCANPSIAAPSTVDASVQRRHPIRALHFVLRSVTVEDAKRLADIAKASGYNTLILAFVDAVNLRTFSGKPFNNSWSVGELLSFSQYARQNGLEVIPEVNLLSHQERFFGNSRPDLMFNSVTYDPRKEGVYKLIFAYLDEIISLLHPSAIHIGHDEVVGWDELHYVDALKTGEVGLPADLFLKDVVILNSFLKSKGVKTWIWGDMLASPDEFPLMMGKILNGGVPGYGRELRSKLPKEVVICDWHYFDQQEEFPMLDALREEGFSVLGTTWRNSKTTRNFSKYSARHGAVGMIATTWFHVQRKEWDVVERIIRESGEVFSKDFPDAK